MFFKSRRKRRDIARSVKFSFVSHTQEGECVVWSRRFASKQNGDFYFFCGGFLFSENKLGKHPHSYSRDACIRRPFVQDHFQHPHGVQAFFVIVHLLNFPSIFVFQSATRFLFKWPHFLLAFYQSNYGPKNPPLHNETKRQSISLIV